MVNEVLAKQVATLVGLGYPAMFDMPDHAFIASLAELDGYTPAAQDESVGRVEFVVVINSPRAPVSSTLPLAVRQGKAPVEKLRPKSPNDFKVIPQVDLPTGEAYLLIDVDRGTDLLNVTPDAAQVAFAQVGRSPLTIAEGVALLTHAPDLLQPNHCFSLLASRCGDKRVPALWLSEGRPKLGWCWAGNPHTWLGSASCGRRAGSATIRAASLSAERG